MLNFVMNSMKLLAIHSIHASLPLRSPSSQHIIQFVAFITLIRILSGLSMRSFPLFLCCEFSLIHLTFTILRCVQADHPRKKRLLQNWARVSLNCYYLSV